jgi:hypothetical protein
MFVFSRLVIFASFTYQHIQRDHAPGDGEDHPSMRTPVMGLGLLAKDLQLHTLPPW